MEKEFEFRSECPVAKTLDIVGDKWSLLIIRDIVKGKSKYKEFSESEEKIPTNILADRLKTLTERGFLKKSHYSNHASRFEYKLTEKGIELAKLVRTIKEWGVRHL